MLVAEPSPPCATSWTCPGPNATASPAGSRLWLSRRPLGIRYCSTRLPSATANDPDDPPWSCQSVSWPVSQASSQTSHAFDRCSGRYQRTSGSWTTRSAQSSRRAASLTVTARSWAGDRRPVRGKKPQSVSTIACCRCGLTPQPCFRPAPTRSGGLAPVPSEMTVAADDNKTSEPRSRGEIPAYARDAADGGGIWRVGRVPWPAGGAGRPVGEPAPWPAGGAGSAGGTQRRRQPAVRAGQLLVVL